MPRFAIDQRRDKYHPRRAWRVWDVRDADDAVLLGEYDTAEAAQGSLNVRWMAPDEPPPTGWRYVGDVEGDEEEDYPHAGQSLAS